jgi:cytochrome c biogenesis protein CcmG/thiol:disulfide interchange protein DsbE
VPRAYDLIWPGVRCHGLRVCDAARHFSVRVVVLNFWASWCLPCKDEAPDLAAAARQYTGRVVFLGVNPNDFKSDARHFLTKYKVDFPSIADPGAEIAGGFGIVQIPETYVLAPNGKIVAHIAGPASTASLAEAIETGLARGGGGHRR